MALNRGYAYRTQVGSDGSGQTLLEWLCATYAHSSAEVWRSRIDGGELTVNDQPAGAGLRIESGHIVEWRRPPWHEADVPLAFDIVYEDPHLLVAAKPSGLPTMPAGGFLEHTLMALVRARHGAAHPVHRLGRYTSGLVVFARTGAAASALTVAWRSRSVVKRYRALVDGVPAWTSTTITAPIGPVPHPRLGSVHAASPSGRPAQSLATVVERRTAAALCEVDITTGRPHQIRIHLASAGHPLAGDPLYAPGGAPRPSTRALPGDGGYWLHAHRLRVAHPVDGRPLEFEAPPPAILCASAEILARRQV